MSASDKIDELSRKLARAEKQLLDLEALREREAELMRVQR